MSNYTVYDSERDQYPHFSDTIQEHFATFASKPLFTTNAEGMFDAFLSGLPADTRQHYTCRCCRQFVERFGGLVALSTKTERFPLYCGMMQIHQRSSRSLLKQ